MHIHRFNPTASQSRAAAILRAAAWSCLIILCAPPVLASNVSDIEVSDNELRATIEVEGLYSAQLTISFEHVVGLNEAALDISASVLNPTVDPLISRLPDPEDVSLEPLFPVLLRIAPSSASSLAFSGIAQVEVSTSSLSYSSEFRLFKASDGGPFRDVTNFSGMGSYRVRGSSGSFSEFLIAADLRDAEGVAHRKFQALATLLDNNADAIEDSVLAELESKLDSALELFLAGLKGAAIEEMEDFTKVVQDNQGSAIPNVYRANDPDSNNVAGKLRTQAATLIFSIKLS